MNIRSISSCPRTLTCRQEELGIKPHIDDPLCLEPSDLQSALCDEAFTHQNLTTGKLVVVILTAVKSVSLFESDGDICQFPIGTLLI